MTADGLRTLTDCLADALGAEALTLRPLDVGCRWPVFRGHAANRPDVFVKLATPVAAARTLAFLRACGNCGLFPKPVLPQTLAMGEAAAVCLEWKESQRVDAEAMTDAQADGLVAGAVALSSALQAAPDLRVVAEDDPDFQHGALCAYAARHRLVGRLLAPLVDLPADLRSYAGRALSVIHGDLHSRNYGFDGDRLAAVFDFDGLTRGLACEDLAFAFTERARKSSLGASARARLNAIFLRVVTASPWSVRDWMLAVNHCRLRIAHRRLESHPASAFVAFDICRRDRPLRAFVNLLGES